MHTCAVCRHALANHPRVLAAVPAWHHPPFSATNLTDALLQVMARVVSHGPDGRLLNATFREADKLEYQDSLGQLALAVAGTVPDGVLLFLPSYSLMDKLRERWKVRCIG